MKISNSEIRAKARTALGGQIFHRTWMLSLAATFIASLVINLVTQISCGIGASLITGPVSVGLHFAFLKLIQKEHNDMVISSIFQGFDDFGSNLVLGLMQTLLISLWSLLFVIPGIIKSYSYALAYYIKAEHPEYGWRECLNESEKMMEGNRMRLFSLNLSFIGWLFLSIFTCGLGSLWVSPYMQASTAVFYEELKKEQGYYSANFTEEPFEA